MGVIVASKLIIMSTVKLMSLCPHLALYLPPTATALPPPCGAGRIGRGEGHLLHS